MDISQSMKASCRQRGATLIVALVMLLLITMIALTSMQGTAMQQHMSGNMKDRDIAFQSAEIGLRVAEQWLEKQKGAPPTTTYKVVDEEGDEDEGYKVFNTGSKNNPIDSDLKSLKDTQGNWFNQALEIIDFDAAAIESVNTPPRITVELVESQIDGIGLGEGYGAVNGGRRWDLYRQTARSTGGSGRAEVILQSHYAIQYD